MFKLGGNTIPGSNEQLAQALEHSARVFKVASPVVTVTGAFPLLEQLTVDLTGGICPRELPRAPERTENEASFDVQRVLFQGAPVHYEGTPFQFRITAEDAKLGFARDRDATPVLTFSNAKSANLEASIKQFDLEAALLHIAQAAAQQQGVSVTKTKLEITATGSRSADFRADVTMQKLFVSGTVRVEGALTITEDFTARVSRLQCSGQGVIGSMICNFLQPYVDRYDNQSIPLAAFPLGEMKLADVGLETGATIRAHASFIG